MARADSTPKSEAGIPDWNWKNEDRTMKILLVDDDPGVTESLVFALERAGHEVQTAGTMVAAMDSLASLEVEVLISDGRFPSHGNEQVFEWGPELTELARKSGLKTILISGNDDLIEAERRKGGKALVKPILAQHILDVLYGDDWDG